LNWTVEENPKELTKCSKIFEVLRDVVQDSFSHFLGLYEMDVMSEDLEDYEEDE
jgi:hypothetical protein